MWISYVFENRLFVLSMSFVQLRYGTRRAGWRFGSGAPSFSGQFEGFVRELYSTHLSGPSWSKEGDGSMDADAAPTPSRRENGKQTHSAVEA